MFINIAEYHDTTHEEIDYAHYYKVPLHRYLQTMFLTF